MTFLKNKFFKSVNESSSPDQITSTAYAEIEGSKTNVEKINTSSDLYYFFSFSTVPVVLEKTFLHVKLQKSNDNFSSNIVDVTGCNYNFSTDTAGGTDHIYKVNNVLFIVQNTNNDSLRLVARAYSTGNRANLHSTPHFDGSASNTKYYYPTLTVKEL
tara:strand:- start:987 stop:1460 length:474 start_codon:yes stop_codon:yes gene_type:complete